MDEKYSILGTTLKGIADAIRRKTGKTGGLVPENMEAEIDSVKTFDDLPALSNPAGAGQIFNGYQALNGDGEVMEGTLVPVPNVAKLYSKQNSQTTTHTLPNSLTFDTVKYVATMWFNARNRCLKVWDNNGKQVLSEASYDLITSFKIVSNTQFSISTANDGIGLHTCFLFIY